jgi:hypothetical protein
MIVQLINKELSSLGTFDALFTNVENSEGNKCFSEGDTSGTV